MLCIDTATAIIDTLLINYYPIATQIEGTMSGSLELNKGLNKGIY
jgi:hypothetical protein